MKAKLKKAFIKDIKAIQKKTRERIENFIFHVVPEVDSITELKNVKKISGYTNYYRIRFGDYRVGFEHREDKIVFYRALHRKDIYRYFP